MMPKLEKEFLERIEKHKGVIFKISKMYMDNFDDQKDLFQEITFQVWKAYPSFEGRSAFSTWLYRITVNSSLNFLRKKKRRGFWVALSELIQIPSKDKPGEIALTEKTEKAIIQQAIDDLPDKQRKAFVLSRYEELPHIQIAEIMKITEGAVEQLLHRAKINLKKILEKNLERP